jgi:hypothetical protein
MLISSADKDCRYLAAPGSDLAYGFGQFLTDVGVTLPLDLRSMIRYGWARPVLRVRLPQSFYLSWSNYPSFPFEGDVSPEDSWAGTLCARCAFPGTWLTRPDLTDDWFTHYLDDPNEQTGREVRTHAVQVGPGIEDPPLVWHPGREQEICPWIDFFGYYQVYELDQIIRAATLSTALLNEPDVAAALEQLNHGLPRSIDHSNLRISHIRRHWEQARHAFEWVSHFRTLLGFWSGFAVRGDMDQEKVRDAASRLMARIGITPEQLKAAIRNILLVEYERSRPFGDHGNGPVGGLRGRLQEDLGLAVSFLREATGLSPDFDDPYWGIPEDRQNRGWTPLPLALPYEELEAKRNFPIYATNYVQDLPPMLGGPIDGVRLTRLVGCRFREPEQLAFRRFCIAFHRLHEEFGAAREDRIGLRVKIPMEFLILCALHAEKVIRDYNVAKRKPAGRLPGTKTFVSRAFEDLLRAYKIRGVGGGIAEFKRLASRADLHDLPRADRLFVDESEVIWGDPVPKRVLAAFVNFLILRNYVAHHDSHDYEIIHTNIGETALRALLVPLVMTLEL